MNFTTYDRDQDTLPNINCAQRMRGAWWYSACYSANPNGHYITPGSTTDRDPMTYWAFRTSGESLRTMKLMFR